LIDVVEPCDVRVSCGPPEGEIIVTGPEPPVLVVVLTETEVAVVVGARGDPKVEMIVTGCPS